VTGFVHEPDEPEESDQVSPQMADFFANAFFGDQLSMREPRE
jgi:hypothetical protein